MTLLPLLEASLSIRFHALSATVAMIGSIALLLLPKGTTQHRILGAITALTLLSTALTSFWIFRTHYSWIHLLSLLTLVSVTQGLYYARHGNVLAHRKCMRGAMTGLFLAAAFTLLPGRIMHAVFMG